MKKMPVIALWAVGLLAMSAASLWGATPTTIVDLRVQSSHPQDAYLAWTVPSESGGVGLGGYDIRYSTSLITDANWDGATQATGLPTPGTPDTRQTFGVTGLQSNTLYYFAMKTSDASVPPNWSELSNVANGTTMPPIQPVTVRNPWLVNDRVADTHNITTMGATYVNSYTPSGMVLPASAEDKAINIYNNQKRRLYHWADEPPTVGGDINDPTYTQNVFGWCLCGRHASQACTIVKAGGLQQRKISLPGHWIYEVGYGDGTYHAYDTMCTMYVYNKASPRKVASCAEMKSDTTLLANAQADGRACPGLLLCGDTISGYQSMINGWGSAGDGSVTTTWNGQLDIRLGQSFKRTWEAWQNQHPTPVTDADSGNIPGPDAPYHHECQYDYKDTVNILYWEPYGQVIPYIHTTRATYRRWSNGTDILTPDFRTAAHQAMLDPASHDIATYYNDGLTPDLHGATVGVQGEAIFKVSVPFYITDANFSGDFVKTNAGDVCKVYVSINGTTWTQVYDAPIGTTHVANQNLRTNVFARWKNWWIKVQVNGTVARSDAGVSNLVVTTIFEHNKGAMAYLDKGVNHVTLTFDNAAELQASRNVIHLVYAWKEYAGSTWNVAKSFETYLTSSPSTFTITTGGTKVPRTEYILMEVTPPPLDPVPPDPIANLAAGTLQSTKVPLTWTATGDDGNVGTATSYDLRYSTSPITDDLSFAAATQAAGVPLPQPAGTPESFTVTGLTGGITYWFAIKVHDKGGNISDLSNVVSVTMPPPDVTPPKWVGNLMGTPSESSGGVDLTWTAPADYGYGGSGPFTCASYDLRYSTSPITEGNFSSATSVAGVSTPKTPSSAETFTVTGLTGGTQYYFTIKSKDDSNNASEVSNSAPGKASKLGEKVLQVGLGGYSGEPDSYIAITSPNTNYGSQERMKVTGYGLGSSQRGILKFDLSSIPGSTVITGATLCLYSYDPMQVGGNSGFYGLYPLTRDWTASQVTWNIAKTGTNWTTQGGDYAVSPDATSPKQSVAGVWYPFDVTSRVQAWIANGTGNYGWIFMCTDENLDNQDCFYQSDTANAAYRPKLLVTDLTAPVAGDINGDGAADVADLLVLAYSFGATCGLDRDYDPRADLNIDGMVDVSDLLILAVHWP